MKRIWGGKGRHDESLPAGIVYPPWHPLTLHFVDADLERRFGAAVAPAMLVRVRVSFLLAALLYGALGLLGSGIVSHPLASSTAPILYAVASPLALLGCLLTVWSRTQRLAPGAAVLFSLVAGLGVVATSALGALPGGYLHDAALLLTCAYTYLLLGLPFIVATLLSWLVAVAYVGAATYAATVPAVLASNLGFLLGINLMGMLASYAAERQARLAYVDREAAEETARRLHLAQDVAQAAHGQLDELERTDALTGLRNRRHLYNIMDREFTRGRRGVSSLALLLVDLDQFSRFNHRHGHTAGDATLRAAGHYIASGLGTDDVAGRHEGDEFLIVLPGTGPEAARAAAEQLRHGIAYVCGRRDSTAAVTASVGIAVLRPEMDRTVDALVERAARALSRAKAAGGDAVACDGDALGTSILASAG